MFSSLASFLPTALRDTVRTSSFTPDNDEQDNKSESLPQALPEDDPQELPPPPKKEKERRNANEIFIVVRPPPSKTNHPLNLQVQLVPPNSRAILPRQSVDFEAGQSSLRRSGSTRSQESSTTYASTSSISSVTSTAASSSTTSARRTIVPLYNLQAHHVLPNVIVDAGTDSKIAKFQKRGLELIDLALFEPVEVWPNPNAVVMPISTQNLAVPVAGPGASTSTLGRLSVDEMGFAQVSTRSGSAPNRSIPTFLAVQPVTGPTNDGSYSAPDDLAPNPATSSSASLSSASYADHQISHSIDSTDQQQPETPPYSAGVVPGSSRRNFFGKMFKKSPKDVPSSPRSPYLASVPPTALPRGNNRQSLSSRFPMTSVQSPVPRPQSARLNTRKSPDTSSESCDQVGTPTPMQPMATPTMQLPSTPKDLIPGAGGKRGRGSWLLGSSGSSQRPQLASPLASAFSTLGMKRRSAMGPSRAADNVAAVNLNLSQTDVETPQVTPSANVASTHVLTSVQSNQIQSQPQLCPAVLGVQPTLVVVPTSFVNSTRGKREGQSKSPNGRPRGSIDGISDNGGSPRPKEKDRSGKTVRRPYMYAWLAKKWMKRRPPPPAAPSHGNKIGLGLHLSGVGAGLGLDAAWVHATRDHEMGVEEIVEVRFEWRRMPVTGGSKKKSGALGEGRESSAEREEPGRTGKRSRRSRDGSRRREGDEKVTRKDGGLDAQNERVRKPSASSISSARAAVKRWSLASSHSQSTAGASEDVFGDTGAGDESDPEDSETPWVCTLKVRRTAAAIAKEAGTPPNPSDASTRKSRGRSKRQEDSIGGEANSKSHEPSTQHDVLRIKVGTLSPTPHHPKVVAMLKMPFPLPDVQVERLSVLRRRGLAPSSQSGSGSGEVDYYGLTLTAEEIKDIVSSTSLWLVVRENIGGVGKVRKGDGWMIRT